MGIMAAVQRPGSQSTMRPIQSLVLIAILSLLSACGGGSGSAAGGAPAVASAASAPQAVPESQIMVANAAGAGATVSMRAQSVTQVSSYPRRTHVVLKDGSGDHQLELEFDAASGAGVSITYAAKAAQGPALYRCGASAPACQSADGGVAPQVKEQKLALSKVAMPGVAGSVTQLSGAIAW
jgi:hypothetical protein